MIVNIKKVNPAAVIPKYAHATDAGLDLTAVSMEQDDYGNIVYHTGLAIEIPYGYVGLIFPRSSLSKYCLSLTNCVGVIDSGYRGEILFKFKDVYKADCSFNDMGRYTVGDKIGQLIILPYPSITLNEVGELSDSDRGIGGFGSTGK